MKRTSTVIAVTSGKGGVGKSLIAVNLAESLALRGHRVALVDVDFGQGACSVLLNETPPASVMDLLRFTARTNQVLHRTSSDLTLVQAAADSGETDGREPSLYGSLDQLLGELRTTHEFVILDAPAGTDGPVRWALDRADIGVIVVVGEPTAVADAYRLARLVWKADPAFPLAVIVNFADTEEEALSVFDRFGRVTANFTGRTPTYLGWVPFSSEIRRSVTDQVPAVRQAGSARKAFALIAETVIHGRKPVPQPVES